MSDSAPLKVLSVASECAPLIKTGGLADVVGALPGALKKCDVQVRTLLPAYPGLLDQLENPKIVWTHDALFDGAVEVFAGKIGKLDLLLVSADHLFDRPGAIYLNQEGQDWTDNPERFAALSFVAASISKEGLTDLWHPDLLHAHDWQAGLAPYYMKIWGVHTPSILTIHNIAFQGLAPAHKINTLRLPSSGFHTEGYEYWGQISTLKAGLMTADAVTTVSPTYMRELASPEYGMGLDGVIRQRSDALHGILNGVELDVWNPKKDPLIVQRFDSKTLKDKQGNKTALLEEFDLEPQEGPLLGIVSRLTRQKGLDLVLEALPYLVTKRCNLVLLGSGDADLEAGYRRAVSEHKGMVGVQIGYDEALSHRIFAGSDSVLVPSRFEPCGLTQMYALRYGAPPLVARTGGLADTVIDANDAAIQSRVATGIQFSPVTLEGFLHAVDRLCGLYEDNDRWRSLQKKAMTHPVGWKKSAESYRKLYAQLAA